VYLSAEIFLWQAVGFVVFYLFFVGFVFYMDLGMGSGSSRDKSANVGSFAGDLEAPKEPVTAISDVKAFGNLEEGSGGWRKMRHPHDFALLLL